MPDSCGQSINFCSLSKHLCFTFLVVTISSRSIIGRQVSIMSMSSCKSWPFCTKETQMYSIGGSSCNKNSASSISWWPRKTSGAGTHQKDVVLLFCWGFYLVYFICQLENLAKKRLEDVIFISEHGVSHIKIISYTIWSITLMKKEKKYCEILTNLMLEGSCGLNWRNSTRCKFKKQRVPI